MLRPRLVFPLVAAAFLLPAAALACFWDYDTLMMERSRFPDTLELITGKFLRHSKEFYEWRIQDRRQKLATDPDNLSYFDDLAVAYDKIGQHDKAIETILIKDKKHPGLYETEANLGTFYIHDGQLEKGLEHINRAIQINPNAHFGREVYQKRLVEYALSRRQKGKTVLPLAKFERRTRANEDPDSDLEIYPLLGEDFASFLFKRNHPGVSAEKRAPAIKGILGMMKFGNYDSPILLEALGNLLSLDLGFETRPRDD